MTAPQTDALFEPMPAPPEPPDLARESDGGIVCELRRVWRDLESIRSSIDSNWPAGAGKHARLKGLVKMQAVIAEAGRRIKAGLNRTPGGATVTQEEREAGF